MGYYESVLGHSLNPGMIPDPMKIGKDLDDYHLSKLIQLILGAAVNCDLKEDFISNIMTLGHETQLYVKQAIEELFISNSSAMNNQLQDGISTGGGQRSLSSIPTALFGDHHQQIQSLRSDVKRLNQELNSVTDAKERATQSVYDLKRDLLTAKEENNQLQVEIEVLQQKLRKSESKTTLDNFDLNQDDPMMMRRDPSDASLKERFVTKLQTRIDQLQEDLFRMENMKEEVRIKNELLESEMLELRMRNEDLQRKAQESRLLKDELDIHKQLSEKAEKYEATIEIYRKKLEEAAEFKRKINEEKNGSSAIRMDLEEEIRKSYALRSQNEKQKAQIQELHSSLAELAHRNENLEYEAKLFSERFATLEEDNQRMRQELVKRGEEISDLKTRIESSSKRSSSNILVNLDEDLSSGMFKDGLINWSTELDMKKTTDELEAKNITDVNAMNKNIEEKDSRICELESENRILKQQLESLKTLDDYEDEKDSNNYGLMRRKRLESVERLESEVQEWKLKSAQLESILQKKEEELTDISNRYKKCVSKAKQVARVLEPISLQTSQSASVNSVSSLQGSPSVASSYEMQLAAEIAYRDRHISELEMEAEKRKAFTEVEERLMSVAFHSLVCPV